MRTTTFSARSFARSSKTTSPHLECRYQAPAATNCRRSFMHLTNFRFDNSTDTCIFFLQELCLKNAICFRHHVCSINKSNGSALQLKLKASTVLQHVQDTLRLPPLWPHVVECCSSTMRALLPKVHVVSRVGRYLTFLPRGLSMILASQLRSMWLS